MADVHRILIVGGGIAGLTLAASLRRHGFSPHLVERGHVWPTVGAGIAVQANGMRILHGLGMGDDVERAGAIIRRWAFCDQGGELLCETDLEALWGNVAPFIGIERSKLHAVLVAGATASSRLSISVVSLTQDDQSVRVGFSDGRSGEYDLVVGADGVSSTVRRLTLTPALPRDLGAMNWRSIAPIRPHGLTRLQFLLGDRCFFGLCPVGDRRTYGFGYVMQPRFHDPINGRLQRLRDRFAAFGGIVREYLASLDRDEQIVCSAIECVDAEEWWINRVVLIGDAAHASSPLMGQGGCMAMEDAWVLAEALRSASSVESALADYVRRRTPRVTWVQQQSLEAAESLGRPPGARDLALREWGDAMLQNRFRPLLAAP